MLDTNPAQEGRSTELSSGRSWWVPPLWMTVVFGFLFSVGILLTLVLSEARQRMHIVEIVHDRDGYVVFDVGGVDVTYHGSAKGPSWGIGGTPTLIEWTAKLLDPTLFYSVTAVSLKESGAHPSPELFAELQRLPRLESLGLSQSSSPDFDSDVAGISALRLKWLSLTRTRAGDEVLRSLQDMTSLEYLDLTRTRVSDRGLLHLHKLTNLKTLKLNRCKVTEQGARDLKARLPGCEVHWEPLPSGPVLRL